MDNGGSLSLPFFRLPFPPIQPIPYLTIIRLDFISVIVEDNWIGGHAMAPKITVPESSDRTSRGYPATPFRQFEDFFNDWAFRSLEGRQGEGFTPPVDILEKDGNLHLMVLLP